MQISLVHFALICINGGLGIARHNEICDDIIHLSKQVFSPNCMSREPLIHLGCSRSEEEVCHGGSIPETRGDMSIRGLWEIHIEAIIDVSFGDAYMETWKPVRIDKLLAVWEKNSKEKHGQVCYYQQRHFPTFVLSVDGMMDKEALVVLANLSQLMAAKTDEPILPITVWVNGWISIAVARLYSRVICGARSPSHLRTRELEWGSGFGLGLVQ